MEPLQLSVRVPGASAAELFVEPKGDLRRFWFGAAIVILFLVYPMVVEQVQVFSALF